MLTRLKAARDVQSEERQQRLKNQTNLAPNPPIITAKPLSPNTVPTSSISTSSTPKLRDYLKSKNTTAGSIAAAGAFDSTSKSSASQNAQYIPPVRPNPLGSENPTQAVCSSGSFYTSHAMNSSGAVHVVAPNEPPPPYSFQQQQYYDPNIAGYTNPMYQQQQQNIAPPAYKLQASPNSQFAHMNANMQNLAGSYNNPTSVGQNDELSQQQRLQQQQQLMMQQTGGNNPTYGQQSTSVAAGNYADNKSNFMQQQAALTGAVGSTAPTNTPYQFNTNNTQTYNQGFATQLPTQGCLPTLSIGGAATDVRAAAIGSQTASQMNTVRKRKRLDMHV